MDIVEKQADEFIRIKYEMANNSNEFIDKLKLELYNYYRTADKVKFIEKILLRARQDRDEHAKVCKSPQNCRELRDYESIVFFTEQELEENGIDNKNLFDSSESFGVNRKVDELIDELKNLRNDIERLKTGQQITYDDFIEEFENLKKQTYLDKKTWRQILMGKLFEMTMSGVISESLSKKIVDIFGDIFPVETIKKLTE
jgi:hypothetical protein